MGYVTFVHTSVPYWHLAGSVSPLGSSLFSYATAIQSCLTCCCNHLCSSLQVYGAYGNKLLPSFIPGDIAWLDAEWGGSSGIGSTSGAAGGRGCLYGIAHVRGGGELGSAWRRGGRRLDKWHSAEDLVAAAEHLVAAGYTRRDMLAAWGRSAGAGRGKGAGPGVIGRGRVGGRGCVTLYLANAEEGSSGLPGA